MLVQYEIIPMKEWLGGLVVTVQQAAGTAGKEMDLQSSCEKWVVRGLGLTKTYGASGVATAARGSGIKPSICPDTASTRAGMRSCLEMCIDIVKCMKEKEDPVTIQSCVSAIIEDKKVGT